MFQELIVASRRLARLYQFKIIYPSHLLHAMTGSETARLVISKEGYDVHVMRAVLINGFKNYSQDADPGSGRIQPSDLFETCIGNCVGLEGKSYEEGVAALFRSIREHAEGDEFLKSSLASSRIRDDQQETAFNPPYFENEDDLLPEVDDLFEREQLTDISELEDLDDLLQDEHRDTGNHGGERSSDLGFSRDRDQVQPGMKAAFQHGRSEANTAQKKFEQPGRESEEARLAMLASQRNLSVLAADGKLDTVSGRDREISQIIEILMRRRKPNVILVAEPGVGKTALVEGLAMALGSGGCPDPDLATRQVIEVSLTSMIGGARYRGDFEARMDLMIRHAEKERHILFIDEIHTLMGSGSVSSRTMDGANILKPVLARDSVSLIGATTPDEADVLREDKALMRRFELIYIDEPLRKQMEVIVKDASAKFLEKHHVELPCAMEHRLLDFGERYVQHRRNPDRTFDILDLAAVSARLRGRFRITEDDLRHAVRRLGGTMMEGGKHHPSRKEELLEYLLGSVIGQDKAMERVSSIVHGIKSGQSSLSPITISGVKGLGKTFAVQKIAEFMGKNTNFIKVKDDNFSGDMIEKRLKRCLEADPDAVLAFKCTSSVLTREVSSDISSFFSSGFEQRSFLVRKPLVFVLDQSVEDRSFGFGFKPAGDETAKDHAAVTFELLEGSSMEVVIEHVISMMEERRRDAGLGIIDTEALRKTVFEGIGDLPPTYSTLLSLALKAL